MERARYLTFVPGNETFATGILAVKEVIESDNLTEAPMVPAYIRTESPSTFDVRVPSDFMEGMRR